jgi:hypothetical protein
MKYQEVNLLRKEGKRWTKEDRRKLVDLWWWEGGDLKKAAKKLGRSEAACWIEFLRLALYGVELAEFRNDFLDLEERLHRIDTERAPRGSRILEKYKPKRKI